MAAQKSVDWIQSSLRLYRGMAGFRWARQQSGCQPSGLNKQPHTGVVMFGSACACLLGMRSVSSSSSSGSALSLRLRAGRLLLASCSTGTPWHLPVTCHAHQTSPSLADHFLRLIGPGHCIPQCRNVICPAGCNMCKHMVNFQQWRQFCLINLKCCMHACISCTCICSGWAFTSASRSKRTVGATPGPPLRMPCREITFGPLPLAPTLYLHRQNDKAVSHAV